MNFRLSILRLLALLMLLPGAFIVFIAIGLGITIGGYVWLLTALLVFLGCLFITIPIRFLKKPSISVASDILTVLSMFIFGAVSSALRKASPDAWGIPKRLEISAENAELVRLLIALLIAWAIHRVLKKRLIDGALTQPIADK